MTTYERFLALESRGIRFGLERIEAMLAWLGHPERKAGRTVLIAGTNGKGSVCSMTSAGAAAAGLNVGLFTSPHLVRVNERFRIGDQDVDDATFDRVGARLLDAIEESEIPLSFFEAMTALAAMLFEDAGVDLQLFEIGLGGARDATAAIAHDYAVVTSVARDHANVLGNSLEGIAREKLGIASDQTRNVFGLPARLRHLAPAGWHLGQDLRYRTTSGGLRVVTPERTLDLPHPALPGPHQRRNAAVAAGLMVRLGLPDDAIAQGLTQVRWRARMQRVAGDPPVWIDGAHNRAAVATLLATLEEEGVQDGFTLVFGAGPQKDVRAMLRRLAPHAGRITLTSVDRLLPPERLARHLKGRPDVHVEVDPAAAVAEALTLGKPVLVAGSLYLAGAVLGWLDKNGRR